MLGRQMRHIFFSIDTFGTLQNINVILKWPDHYGLVYWWFPPYNSSFASFSHLGEGFLDWLTSCQPSSASAGGTAFSSTCWRWDRPFSISSSYLSTSACSGSSSGGCPGKEHSSPAACSAVNLFFLGVVFCLGPEKQENFELWGLNRGGTASKLDHSGPVTSVAPTFLWTSAVVRLAEGWGVFTARSAMSSPGSFLAKTMWNFLSCGYTHTDGTGPIQPHCDTHWPSSWATAWTSSVAIGRPCSCSMRLLLWADSLLGSWKARKFFMGSQQKGGTAGKPDHSGLVTLVAPTFLLDLSQWNVVLWCTAVDLNPDGLTPLQLRVCSVAGLLLWRVLWGSTSLVVQLWSGHFGTGVLSSFSEMSKISWVDLSKKGHVKRIQQVNHNSKQTWTQLGVGVGLTLKSCVDLEHCVWNFPSVHWLQPISHEGNFATRSIPSDVCKSEPHTSRRVVFQHWMGIAQPSLWNGVPPLLHSWKESQGADRPQTTGINLEEVNCNKLTTSTKATLEAQWTRYWSWTPKGKRKCHCRYPIQSEANAARYLK